MSNIIVIAEHMNGALKKASKSTVAFAKEAAAITGGQVIGVVLGHNVGDIAAEFATAGVDKVLVHDDAVFAAYLAENYAPALVKAAQDNNASVVAGSTSTFAKDLMPRVAGLLEAGMVSDAVSVFDEGGIKFKRPIWAGNVIITVDISTPIKVATVRSTEFDPLPAGAAAPIEAFDSGVTARDGVEFISFDQVKSERPELTDANVVIAGGRGLGSKENFNLVLNLADKLNAAVGATRAAIDSGYAPNDWQIGQTGKVVAQNLYIAVAISGAIQHLAGMKGSNTIVAINTDPDAPIFQVSDYGLVADAFEVVPDLLEKI